MKINNIEIRSCAIFFEPTRTIYIERCDYRDNHLAYMEREIRKGQPAYAYFKWQVTQIISNMQDMKLVIIDHEEEGYWVVLKA